MDMADFVGFMVLAGVVGTNTPSGPPNTPVKQCQPCLFCASLASLSSSPSSRVLEINGANMDHVRSVQDATALLNQAMPSIFISIIVAIIVNSFTQTGSRRSFHHPAEEHHLLWTSQLIIKVGHISCEDGCN